MLIVFFFHFPKYKSDKTNLTINHQRRGGAYITTQEQRWFGKKGAQLT